MFLKDHFNSTQEKKKVKKPDIWISFITSQFPENKLNPAIEPPLIVLIGL
jgi:hypothetical protein